MLRKMVYVNATITKAFIGCESLRFYLFCKLRANGYMIASQLHYIVEKD